MRSGVLVCAGLLLRCGGASAPAAPPAVESATPGSAPILEVAPAPASSGQPAPPAAATRSAVRPPEEDEVEGGGKLSSRRVLHVVMARKADVHACYENEARTDPTLKGDVILAWRVLKDGSVLGPKIVSTTLKNARVEGCILRSLNTWTFPASESETVIPTFPFRFGPPGPESPVP